MNFHEGIDGNECLVKMEIINEPTDREKWRGRGKGEDCKGEINEENGIGKWKKKERNKRKIKPKTSEKIAFELRLHCIEFLSG
jgi:hypothetical protein